jgi:pilus assembly protein Flp/PilA
MTAFGAGALTREWAMARLIRILRCTVGATAIEYALIASLISIAAITAMNGLGNHIDTMLGNVSNHLQ